MAKNERENFDFDDLVMPDAPVDLVGETPAAAGATADEAPGPLAAQPPAEAAAVADQHDEDQYAKQLRAEDLHVEDLLGDQAETKQMKEARERSRGGFWETLSKADLYTVMLGVALAAVGIAVLCLLTELASYRFDIKAKEGKAASQKVTWAAQSACATTMPTA